MDSLVAGIIGRDTLICYSTTPDTLNMLTNATGRSGIYSYQWQISIDSNNWNNIPSADSTFYFTSELTTSTYYRLVQTSTMNCGSVHSNVVKISVLPLMSAPIVDHTTAMVCYDSVPGDVHVLTYPSGADGKYRYQW